MNRKKNGFSLTEILVCMAIIALMAVVAAPMTTTLLNANKLNQSLQIIDENLSIARQTAISHNRAVEIRFYNYSDPSTPSSASAYRAVQIFEVTQSDQLTPLNKVRFLPQSIVIDSTVSISSMLDPAKVTTANGDVSLPRIGLDYKYASFRFNADGSTDLLPTAGPWTLTIHDEAKGSGTKSLTGNFATLEIDPLTGTIKYFHP